jgi:N-acetylmuramoyl-L-alanine amidase
MVLLALALGLILGVVAPAAAGTVPIVSFEGQPYIELARVAASLDGRLEAGEAPGQAVLRVAGRRARVTRDRATVHLSGHRTGAGRETIELDAPVRVFKGAWLAPRSFAEQVLPHLVAPAPAAAASSARAATVPSASVAAVRIGSHGTHTRIVLETSAPVSHRIEARRPGDVRIRVSGLAAAAARHGVDDGLVTRVQLEPDGADVVVTVALGAPDAELRTVVLSGPPRLVLDVVRSVAARPAVEAMAARVEETTPPEAVSAARPAAAARLAAAGAAPGRGLALNDLRHRSYPDHTRVVLETGGPLLYDVESSGPREARIKLAALRGRPRVEPIRDGHIDRILLEAAGPDTILKVTFQGPAGELRTATLADPDRLVLDFMHPDGVTRGPRESGDLRLLVLDAGHGGHDTGALGPTGLAEKDLVLDVARRIGKLVEEGLGIRVLLTRRGDHFVPLRERTSFANREQADIFVSIHANAHRESASRGVETFFLSSEATDGAARQLAQAENDALKLEKPPAGGRPDIVRTMLWDLAQSGYAIQSSRLAEIVQDSMTRALNIPNRGVKQAGFYVLGGAAMPAILVEIGFVTNPAEERRLRDSRYRDEIARAVFEGLAQYKRHWDRRMRTVFEQSR